MWCDILVLFKKSHCREFGVNFCLAGIWKGIAIAEISSEMCVQNGWVYISYSKRLKEVCNFHVIPNALNVY